MVACGVGGHICVLRSMNVFFFLVGLLWEKLIVVVRKTYPLFDACGVGGRFCVVEYVAVSAFCSGTNLFLGNASVPVGVGGPFFVLNQPLI